MPQPSCPGMKGGLAIFSAMCAGCQRYRRMSLPQRLAISTRISTSPAPTRGMGDVVDTSNPATGAVFISARMHTAGALFQCRERSVHVWTSLSIAPAAHSCSSSRRLVFLNACASPYHCDHCPQLVPNRMARTSRCSGSTIQRAHTTYWCGSSSSVCTITLPAAAWLAALLASEASAPSTMSAVLWSSASFRKQHCTEVTLAAASTLTRMQCTRQPAPPAAMSLSELVAEEEAIWWCHWCDL
mmetsp:Transcript_8902/g.27579  ORF Transcript_8902/g.27579 Transcript_8902/m.27579 type:complete len:242 (+) Transcript_8902:918-1643(+)